VKHHGGSCCHYAEIEVTVTITDASPATGASREG
jgi:hypothetical protein